MMKNLGVFYLNFDGYASMYCGVGAVAQYFIHSISNIHTELFKKNYTTDFHLIFPKVKPTEKCFSEEVLTRSKGALSSISSYVTTHFVFHSEEVSSPFGDERTWEGLCIQAVTIITENLSRYEKVIVIANDVPFALVGEAIRPYLRQKKIQLVWLPHSTSRLYPNQLDHSDTPRQEAEQSILELSMMFNNCYIGSTSAFMTSHLINDWGLNKTNILDYRVGVSSKYLNQYYKVSQQEIEDKLFGLGVPPYRRLALIFGRADFHKGIDLGLHLMLKLCEEEDIFPIVLASNFGTEHSSKIIRELKEISTDPNLCLFSTHFDFALPKYILQSSRLCFVLIPSRNENISLIPMESRVLSNGNSIVIASDTGGLKEQIVHGVNGFLVDMMKLDGTLHVCRDVLSLSKNQTNTISKQGLQTVEKQFDLSDNMVQSISLSLQAFDNIQTN